LYNPTGTFDNDQYLLEIVVPQGDPDNIFDQLVDFVDACGGGCQPNIKTGEPCKPYLVPIPVDEGL
jgi:hypothetical protein